MATDYWNQSLFTCKKHHGQIMNIPDKSWKSTPKIDFHEPHPQPKGDLHQGNRHR